MSTCTCMCYDRQHACWFPQENVRRLFSANSASDEFNKWCEQELKTFNTDVDGKRSQKEETRFYTRKMVVG